jgi:hypothetical protein
MQDSLFGDDRVDRLVRALQALTWTQGGRTVHWPADDKVDRAFAAKLMDESSDRDIVAKLAKFPQWMKEHPQTQEVNPRARIQNWICYRDRFPDGNARSRKHNRGERAGRTGSSAGGAPAGPDAWAGKSGKGSWA